MCMWILLLCRGRGYSEAVEVLIHVTTLKCKYRGPPTRDRRRPVDGWRALVKHWEKGGNQTFLFVLTSSSFLCGTLACEQQALTQLRLTDFSISVFLAMTGWNGAVRRVSAGEGYRAVPAPPLTTKHSYRSWDDRRERLWQGFGPWDLRSPCGFD